MTETHGSAAPNPPAAFPFQRPARASAIEGGRQGLPRPLRWMLRRFARFDYDVELAYALAHAEDLPMVALAPRGSRPDRKEGART